MLLVTLVTVGCATTPPSSEAPDRRPAVAVDAPPDARSRECLALTMYWEARGEGRTGMLAVGAVVLNRVADHRFPDTVCGVVYQGGETPPCQFSWWCDGRSDRPSHAAKWSASLNLAGELLAARAHDPTHGALFFHNTSISAPWRRTQTAQIGNHVFYR